MVKILNSANETLSLLQNVSSAEISEEINGAFTFTFSTDIDNKASDIYHGHKAEVEDNYFNIMRTYKTRTDQGISITANCEHVSYDLIRAVFTAGFTFTGLASAAFTYVISATNTALSASFTLGTFETTTSETLSINESTNARSVIMALAALYGGELKFDKYSVSLLTRRGADRGAQFRYRKNISNAGVSVDYQTLKDDGSPTVTYEVGAAELEYEQSFIDGGYSGLEHFELGDTIRVIDDDLDIDISARIVKHTYDPLQRMLGTVEIGDYVNDITKTLTQMKTTSVVKDRVYNSCSIGPEYGFVSERSDGLTKTYSDATDGFTMQLRNSITASYTAVFYVRFDTATGTVQLYLGGNAVFSGSLEAASGTFGGTVQGATIVGSTILAGTTSIVTAPFSVTQSGAVTAKNINITGGVFNIGTGTNTFQFNQTNGLFMGATSVSTAPFSVTMSGSMTAANATITGNILASRFYGSTTASGSIGISDGGGSSLADVSVYRGGSTTPAFQIYDDATIFELKARGTASTTATFMTSDGADTYAYGAWHMNTATRIGIGTQLSFSGTSAGGTLYLRDDDGNLVDSVVIP
ncbi:MAG: prophage endopeptidase tail family protein [Eubacteriales bacterium]|nr:prophage endopeptidase tail family protein [Eubacteriales bacterium]